MRRRYDASAKSVTPISCRPVSPAARHSAMAARTASSKRASDGSGSARWTSRWAVSMRRPVGSPAASFTTMPPVGSGVARVIPASWSAAELTHVAWPSIRTSATGLRGAARSIAVFVGKLRLGQRFWSQPRPLIHSPGRAAPAASATIRAISSSDVTPPVSSVSRPRARYMRWPCASTNPGRTARPPRSIVGSPAGALTSLRRPANTTRPSLTTRVSATVPASSRV